MNEWLEPFDEFIRALLPLEDEDLDEYCATEDGSLILLEDEE